MRKGFCTASVEVLLRCLMSLWLTLTSTPGDCSRKEAASWAQVEKPAWLGGKEEVVDFS